VFNLAAAAFYVGIMVLAALRLVVDVCGGWGRNKGDGSQFRSSRGGSTGQPVASEMTPVPFISLGLTLGPLLYFAALHLLFVGSIRYRLPAEYAVLVLSAAGARSVWVRLSAGRNGLRPQRAC
jgi:hypothetical protein